ncbi:ribonuclease Z [Robiginitalea sp. M366]|uniref:ribonuclease Z n=1 Tax=Robiginitalea aestuariiviva TaxID=3036903 RepID=UPI00240D5725|nr:ribonuclease Z [Robiginitalea aestuariiviva]MDG1572606.1 ribonuclease Z [Robiginitalea aestuariiviva]
MRLQIIGCHAATPRHLTHPSAQILEAGGHMVLIDCGEGTQMELRRYRIKFSRIGHIFISHLHGDHFFGLPGLISTFRLLGREKPLHIYGPKGIKEAVTLLLKLGDSWTQYPLHFHELTATEPEVILEDTTLQVSTLPLAHRVYTNGYLFRQQPGLRKLDLEKATALGIDRAYFRRIQLGEDVPGPDGKPVPNREVSLPPPPPASYAYCSDTAYKPELTSWINGVDRLYHEATFLETEAHLASKTGHSTARQAARIAADAGVGQLILGHFSTRYKDLSAFRTEAAAIFTNTELAEDGKQFQW